MSGRKLFLRVDPTQLDRYTKKSTPRRRKRNITLIRQLDLIKRALQVLPPRELTILYSLKVTRVEQDDIKELFNVRQSNISYRLERAESRIKLHNRISETCSETTLRSVLYAVGLQETVVRTVIGVVKTSSQSATATAYGVTQGSVRHLFATALTRVSEAPDTIENKKEALELMNLISMNYNQLRSIRPQRRWQWKVGQSNYVSDDEEPYDLSES